MNLKVLNHWQTFSNENTEAGTAIFRFSTGESPAIGSLLSFQIESSNLVSRSDVTSYYQYRIRPFRVQTHYGRTFPNRRKLVVSTDDRKLQTILKFTQRLITNAADFPPDNRSIVQWAIGNGYRLRPKSFGN